MSVKKDFWCKVIGEDWYNFYPELWDSDYMDAVMTFISNKYSQATIYPDMKSLFKPFKLCPYDKFKVLILGQDPYPDGSATGLAFANNEDTMKVNPSLEKIRDCVEREIYDGFNIAFDLTLEQWAKQGVLLLNTSLTFERYKGGHAEVWQDFINQFLVRVNQVNGSHVCLWGSHAKAFKKYLDETKVYIYEEVHPAYSARNNVDWQCNHFKEINNKIIKQNGKEEIIIW